MHVPSDRAARAGLSLVEGALRLRRTGDGLYGVPPVRPATKPAEALSAWIASIARDESGSTRAAELREAVVAAAEEVDAAAQATSTPGAARLREALYRDALAEMHIGQSWFSRAASSPALPWTLAGLFAGTLIGLLLGRNAK